MPIRESQARPAYAPPRPPPTRPHDWALGMGLASRPATLASSSGLRLRHQPPSPAAHNDLGASSSAAPRRPDLSQHRRRLGDRWTPFVEVREGTRRARSRAGGLCSRGRAGASSPSPPPHLGSPPRPSLARTGSCSRLEDATMSLLEPLARRTVPNGGCTGASSGAGAGGRPRALHLGPCTSLLFSLLVPQARVCTLAPLGAAR